MKVLPDIEFLIFFFFSTFKYVIPLPSRLHGFWWKIGCWSYCRALVHLLLLELFLCLLRVWLWSVLIWGCKFILLEVYWTWICRFMSSSSNLGKFSVIFYSNICSALSSLSSSGTSIMHILICLLVFHRSFRLCSFFFILFSFCSSNWIISVVLSSNSLIPSSAFSNLLLNPSSEV